MNSISKLTQPKILRAIFLGNLEDKEYALHLRGMFNGLDTFVCFEPIESLLHLEMYAAKRQATQIVCTKTAILSKLLELQGNPKSEPSLSDYQGSLFTYKNLEIVFISPLKQLFTVPYGKFIAARFISKVTAPDSWAEATNFSFEVLDSGDKCELAYQYLSQCIGIATDIETFKDPLSIRCIGFTGVCIQLSGRIVTRSYVLPVDSEFNYLWLKKFCQLPVAKIFQNGKYDNAYLLRYRVPVVNWLWDTQHFFHSWYSELPKDLAFLNAFFLRKVVYWKDLADTSDLYEYYKYNALDTWATANVWIQQMLTAPDWARHNYVLEFPKVFPCLLAEMTGIRRDMDKLLEARKIIEAQEEVHLTSLRKILGAPNFNPSSPPQVKQVLKLLGCGDIDSTNEKDLAKAKLRHPLNAVVFDKILTVRGLRKLRTNYLRLDSDDEKGKGNGGKEFNGFILYSLNPHGTDTGRLASKESAFWCGLQIQNIPRGEPGEPSYTKTTLRCEEGFFLGECDLEQAEARDTGYISGDTELIAAVSGVDDFHSSNASSFFGRPYETIYDNETKKTKDKPLRDLAKRTNHGANYNMGPEVMVDTMGLDKVWQAKQLLKLPYFQATAVAEHLLTVFHLKYKKLRGPIKFRHDAVRIHLKLPNCDYKLYAPNTYYASIAYEVSTTRKITSRAYHHTPINSSFYGETPEAIKQYIERGDWTRYCFGKPDTNKLDLNSYVAHPPQSLNARTLNEAWIRVFYEVALPNADTFRLHAQIHDSILFSYREGYEHLAEKVKECMEIPVTVRDVFGTYRTFTVPASLKLGIKDKTTGNLRRAIYWSETE